MDEARRKGLEKMNEVYGWEMPDLPGDYFAMTVEHLFGTVWTRPALAMRDRRLMLLAVLTAQGQDDLLEIQINAALHNGELTKEELREAALFVTHYVGWPLGSKLNNAVERVLGKRKKAAQDGAGDDKKAAASEVVAKAAGKADD
jgi:4-carboxymuconolactone decarboxylase